MEYLVINIINITDRKLFFKLRKNKSIIKRKK